MRRIFERDVYIRLAEDGEHFISTTHFGCLFKWKTAFDVNCGPAREAAEQEETFLAPLKKRLPYRTSNER